MNEEKSEKPKLTLVSDNPELVTTPPERAMEYDRLVYSHKCAEKDKPEWCVVGHDGMGGKGVLFWIRPSPDGEWVARRIAKYLKDQGGKASVEMTRWNPDHRDTTSGEMQLPVRKQGNHI